MNWKKGRGKLGIFTPLLGDWSTSFGDDTEQGVGTCTRTFSKTLDGKYIQLNASWNLEARDYTYDEICLFGVDKDKQVNFWSFTSDGKQSRGVLADGTDIHPQALCFEADMEGRIARQVFWPHEEVGFNWVVESKNKKGWNRFFLHHYLPV